MTRRPEPFPPRREAGRPARRLAPWLAGALFFVLLPLWCFRAEEARPAPSPAREDAAAARGEGPALVREERAAPARRTGREASRGDAAAHAATPPRAPSIEVVLAFAEPLPDGEPVRGEVRLVPRIRTRGGALELPVDAEGRAVFSGLRAGGYRVEVVAGSLPADYLLPWRQDVTAPWDLPGYYGRELALEAGAHERVVVPIHRARVIRGYVLGPAGAAVADVVVRMQSKVAGLNALRHEARTDATGYFECRGVYPGVYAAQVDSGSVAESRRVADLPHPYPERVDVREALAADVTLAFACGPVTLVGEVFDQDGEPFPGLLVLAYYAGEPDPVFAEDAWNWNDEVMRGRTDVHGAYRLEGVPARRIQLQIEPEGALRARDSKGIRLGANVPVVALDLRGRSGVVRAEPRTAVRSRPFTVRGTVQLDPAWRRRHRAELSDLSIKVFLVDPEAARRLNRIASFLRVELAADGAFEWQCESTRDVAIMEITSWGAERASKRMEFTPMENETVEVLITFPGE